MALRGGRGRALQSGSGKPIGCPKSLRCSAIAAPFLLPFLDRDGAFEIEHGAAGECDPIPAQRANELAAARRDLLREELLLAEPRRPVGCQHAMGGSGDRVLVDAMVWCEVARNEVGTVAAGCRRDRVRAWNSAHCGAVGLQSGHLFGAVVDREGAAACN